MKAADLVKYFTEGVAMAPEPLRTVGMEIETMFVDAERRPITMEQSQSVFSALQGVFGWRIVERKGGMITKLDSPCGDTVSYELGRNNIELAMRPAIERDWSKPENFSLIAAARAALGDLYGAASAAGAYPFFSPVFDCAEDLLAIPDERDLTWLMLDGREALNLLARTASVQFMFTVRPDRAIDALNALLGNLPEFLRSFPQERLWRRYIAESRAGYASDRYGGPGCFESIEDYCNKLSEHPFVTPAGLVPFAEMEGADIGMYLRSIWWYFRLRRFGSGLCVEVRPMPRLNDEHFPEQLRFALEAAGGPENLGIVQEC